MRKRTINECNKIVLYVDHVRVKGNGWLDAVVLDNKLVYIIHTHFEDSQ